MIVNVLWIVLLCRFIPFSDVYAQNLGAKDVRAQESGSTQPNEEGFMPFEATSTKASSFEPNIKKTKSVNDLKLPEKGKSSVSTEDVPETTAEHVVKVTDEYDDPLFEIREIKPTNPVNQNSAIPVTTTTTLHNDRDTDLSGESIDTPDESEAYPRPFDIVYPVRVRKSVEYDLDTHDPREKGGDEHYQHITIVIDMFGETYRLKLQLNRELLEEAVTVRQSFNKDKIVTQKTKLENCFYQGTIKKEDDSAVALSTCQGLHGIIRMQNHTYIIKPLGHHNQSGEAHIVYRAPPPPHRTCGVDGGMWRPYQELHRADFLRSIKAAKYHKPAHQQLLERETKYLELGLIADHSMFSRFDGSVTDTLLYLVGVANIADQLLSPLGVRVQVASLEVWSGSVDLFPVSDSPRHVLHHMVRYNQGLSTHSHPDVNVLISGAPSPSGTLGLAVPDAVCTDRAVAVVMAPSDPRDPSLTAAGLTHMLGHSLGARHDHHNPCECDDPAGCLMDESPFGRGSGLTPRHFSACSQKDLNGSLVVGLAPCLSRRRDVDGGTGADVEATAGQAPYAQTCGNGIVERGEECDCGNTHSCAPSDPCCDAATCLLVPWASCRHGDCCHNCTLAPASYLCRAPATECDVPEFCTGRSGECPVDALYQDGSLCSSGASYCYLGQCTTVQDQCHAIWGNASEPGDIHCYQNFNPSGQFNGHCGINRTTGLYNKCSLDDVRCGLLHCQGGEAYPLHLNTHITFSMSKTVSTGNTYECKIVTGDLREPGVGLVADGSPCAIGGLCVAGRCTPITDIVPVTCPLGENNLPCSGNGVCTTRLECFCSPRFSGLACEVYTPPPPTTPSPAPTSTTTPPPPAVTTGGQEETTVGGGGGSGDDAGVIVEQKKNTGLDETTLWLMVVLGGVSGGGLLLLLFCMCCYRRRSSYSLHSLTSSGRKKKQHLKKKHRLLGGSTLMATSSNYDDDVASLASSRVITFGKMPSYRADKLKKALRKSMGEASETGSEHSGAAPASLGSQRSSAELSRSVGALAAPVTLPPAQKGILKKYPRSTDDVRKAHLYELERPRQRPLQPPPRICSQDLDPLRGLVGVGSPLADPYAGLGGREGPQPPEVAERQRPNAPLAWLKAMPARPLPPTPTSDEDEDDDEGAYQEDEVDPYEATTEMQLEEMAGGSEGEEEEEQEYSDTGDVIVSDDNNVSGSECGSQCSCDSDEKKNLSDFDDDEVSQQDSCYTEEDDDDEEKPCLGGKDVQTQTDSMAGTPTSPRESPAAVAPSRRRGMPPQRDSSSESLGEAKSRILKLKNINDLLRQIDEQFNSVLAQTAAAGPDFSPATSSISPGETTPCSETEADRQFHRGGQRRKQKDSGGDRFYNMDETAASKAAHRGKPSSSSSRKQQQQRGGGSGSHDHVASSPEYVSTPGGRCLVSPITPVASGNSSPRRRLSSSSTTRSSPTRSHAELSVFEDDTLPIRGKHQTRTVSPPRDLATSHHRPRKYSDPLHIATQPHTSTPRQHSRSSGAEQETTASRRRDRGGSSSSQGGEEAGSSPRSHRSRPDWRQKSPPPFYQAPPTIHSLSNERLKYSQAPPTSSTSTNESLPSFRQAPSAPPTSSNERLQQQEAPPTEQQTPPFYRDAPPLLSPGPPPYFPSATPPVTQPLNINTSLEHVTPAGAGSGGSIAAVPYRGVKGADSNPASPLCSPGGPGGRSSSPSNQPRSAPRTRPQIPRMMSPSRLVTGRHSSNRSSPQHSPASTASGHSTGHHPVTHPLLDGYPFRAPAPHRSNTPPSAAGANSEGYHSDSQTREIPAKPGDLQFATKKKTSKILASPEDVDV